MCCAYFETSYFMDVWSVCNVSWTIEVNVGWFCIMFVRFIAGFMDLMPHFEFDKPFEHIPTQITYIEFDS